MNFMITIYGLSEEESHNLWLRHKTKQIHCLVFDGKTYISGEADKPAVEALISDIKALGNEYGIVSEDLM